MDKRRDLNISAAVGNAAHLSAASGVVKLGERVFVVADDNYNLAEFSLQDLKQPGVLHRLIPDRSEGASGGPQFESLIYLASECMPPAGALLAVPSGASADKCTGAIIPMTEDGKPNTPKEVSFSSLYASLAQKISDLNIEGAVCGPDKVFLFQRGNSNGSRNAVIELHRDRFIDCLLFFSSAESIALDTITDCELGDVGGHRLGFTDAASLSDGRIVFTAAAEDGGRCKGFAIGLMNSDLQVQKLKKFDRGPKVEGIFAESLQPPLLWMIFDNAQPDQPSSLFTMALE